jgi:protein subunit release factor A
MSTIILEIIAGEGGKDSKLFVVDMMKMYKSYAEKKGFDLECL